MELEGWDEGSVPFTYGCHSEDSYKGIVFQQLDEGLLVSIEEGHESTLVRLDCIILWSFIIIHNFRELIDLMASH